MIKDLIGYNEIVENSMRNIVRGVLKKAQKTGLQGEHHFVISFLTRFPGVEIPEFLLLKYTEEMIIVIQHQFYGLVVDEEEFKIQLSFSGNYEKITIPYKSIVSFSDPSVNFGLKFTQFIGDDIDDVLLDEKDPVKEKLKEVDLSQKVISLDAFRKNREKKD